MAEDVEVKETTKPRNSKLLIIIIGVVVLLLASVVAFVAGKLLFADKSGIEKEETYVLGPTFDVNEITVNISNSGGRRFLMTQLSVEVNEKKVLAEVDKKLPIVQDKLIMVLSSQTLEDLSSQDGMEILKEQLIDALNEVLNTGEVTNIYYNKFVWQ